MSGKVKALVGGIGVVLACLGAYAAGRSRGRSEAASEAFKGFADRMRVTVPEPTRIAKMTPDVGWTDYERAKATLSSQGQLVFEANGSGSNDTGTFNLQKGEATILLSSPDAKWRTGEVTLRTEGGPYDQASIEFGAKTDTKNLEVRASAYRAQVTSEGPWRIAVFQ